MIRWWRQRSGLQRLGLGTILGALALVTLGGAVRVTDSGLACPDWPLCDGRIIPTGDFHVWIEWTHRLLASVVGLAILAVWVVAWRRYRDRPWIIVPATLAIVALGVQVVLGGLTVTEDLAAEIVSAHLATAMVIVLLLMASWLATFALPDGHAAGAAERRTAAIRTARWALATGVGIYALMVLGAYVSGTDAGFACRGWPSCNDAFLPQGRLASIHVAHRYLAAFVALLVIATIVVAWRGRRGGGPQLALALGVAALFLAQALVGAANIWTTMQDWARIAHVGVAAALWATTVPLTAVAAQRAGWIPAVGRTGPLPAFLPRWVRVKESEQR